MGVLRWFSRRRGTAVVDSSVDLSRYEYRPNASWRFIGSTAKDRVFKLANDCDGSSRCCAEIHIERMYNAIQWEEMHLTYEECGAIREMLRVSMEKYMRRLEGVSDDED